jgi:outer membrane protein assembly factor BamD (BamD/ComL family)
MGRKRARKGQYFYFCVALLVFLSGCSLSQESIRRRDMRDALYAGDRLLVHGDFDESLRAFEKVVVMAGDSPPADAAVYKTGLAYAHPNNPKRDLHKAMMAFSRVASGYPNSAWGEQAKVWVEVLKETEESKKKVEQTRQAMERSQAELEKNRQVLEKSKQEIEKSRLELDRTRQEIEKTKQVIEKSKQVDIEIDQKRRDRGR